MSEIVTWGAVETVARLSARDVSAEEVCVAHLARLEAVNAGLNVIVGDAPDARGRAQAIDAGRVPPGLLHGAPVTTKINTDQAGLVATNGLPAMRDNVAQADSAVVGNLHSAGAVVVGRTNVPEFSLRWCSSNPVHGVTQNPWGLGMTPGGSSGGAAAAVAAGVGVIAQGNDLGGSVRYPAYCCGIVGMKPSSGRVPAYNPSAGAARGHIVTSMSVQGPLARSVADAALGLAAMRAGSAHDPHWVDGAPRVRAERPLRIGVLAEGFKTHATGPVLDAMARAEAAARAAGVEIVAVDVPQVARATELWGELLFSEGRVMMRADVNAYGSEALRHWVGQFEDHFASLDLEGYVRAQAERGALQRAWSEMFAGIDALVMPTSLIAPFANDLEFHDPSQSDRIIAAQAPLYIVNLLGLPSCALPTHVAEGVPMGVQVVGAWMDDDRVLEVAAALERDLGSVLDQMPEDYRLVG